MAAYEGKLAAAIVHWASLEVLCGRKSLLSEASLAQPIGQFLNSALTNPIEPEVPHPILGATGKQGRQKSIDFVIRPKDSSVIVGAIETKWVTNKRDFKQEIFNDLARLELVHTADRPMTRLLVLAGEYKHLEDKVLNADGNIGAGGGRARVFGPVLPVAIGTKLTVPIRDSVAPQSAFWQSTSTTLKKPIAISLTSQLTAKYPDNPSADDVACMIWAVGRVGRRAEVTYDETNKQWQS